MVKMWRFVFSHEKGPKLLFEVTADISSWKVSKKHTKRNKGTIKRHKTTTERLKTTTNTQKG